MYVIRQVREIVFEFRSTEAQGLLLYQTLRNPPADEPKYELYVLLEGGELKTIHVFGANETTLLVGKGLNRDWWHRAKVRVDPALALLQVVQLINGPNGEVVRPLKASAHRDIVEGCVDKLIGTYTHSIQLFDSQ